MHRVCRARLPAFRHPRGRRALLPGAGARRRHRGPGPPADRARARRGPFHGRVRRAARRHRPPAACTLPRHRRLRLRRRARQEGEVPGRVRSRGLLFRSQLVGSRSQVCLRPDARPVPEQGPARLGGVCAPARRAFGEGPGAHHARRADAPAFAVRAGRGYEAHRRAHAHRHRRRGRPLPRARAPDEAQHLELGPGGAAARRPHHQHRGPGSIQPGPLRVLHAGRLRPRRAARPALARLRDPRLQEMILLSGGSGFIGLNVAEQILARGEEVLIFDLRPPPPSFAKALFVHGDVSSPETVWDLFEKHSPTHVIHMSAITAGPERDAREPRRIAEVNLLGTLNVLEASKKAGVRRFVHASTGALFGAAGMGVLEPLDEERHRPVPESMYGITKYAAERSCLRLAALWGLDVRIGRLAMAFGRWEHETGVRDRLSPPTEIARIAHAGREAVFPPLGDTDYIYGPDVASALIALLDATAPSHRLYHLGTGSAWALPAWCKLLEKRFPKFRWHESSEGCNVVPLAPGTRSRFSNRRLTEDLGWAPRFDLTAAADDFIAWLEAQRTPRSQ